MDGEQFDDFVKHLGTRRLTRLSALRGLIGGSAAVPTGATIASWETAAKKSRKGKKRKGKKRKQRHDTATVPTKHTAVAPAPEPAGDPDDPCGEGYTRCGYVCVSTDCGAHGTWNERACRCDCDDGKEWCEKDRTCVKADCAKNGEWSSHRCECKQPPAPPDPAGTCTAEQEDLCQELDFAAANCNDAAGCSCYTTTTNARFCGRDASAFCPEAGCQGNADCGGVAVCAQVLTAACDGCSPETPEAFCVQPCGSVSQICVGEDSCAPSGEVICGGSGGLSTCFCHIRADTGGPVCAQAGSGNPCDSCDLGEICIDCAGEESCVLLCQDPF